MKPNQYLPRKNVYINNNYIVISFTKKRFLYLFDSIFSDLYVLYFIIYLYVLFIYQIIIIVSKQTDNICCFCVYKIN